MLRALNLLRRLRAWLRHAAGGRGHGIPQSRVRCRLQETYRAVDPWGMHTEREQFRFAATNDIILRELACAERFDSALEIGCGEGHQSLHLAPLCDQFIGIDIVEDAVRRARERLPGARFVCGELAAQPWRSQGRRFGLVTACEVLFYFSDVPETLATMSALGRNCIVTCHEPSLHVVARALEKMPLMGRSRLQHGAVVWHAFWWRNE